MLVHKKSEEEKATEATAGDAAMGHDHRGRRSLMWDSTRVESQLPSEEPRRTTGDLRLRRSVNDKRFAKRFSVQQISEEEATIRTERKKLAFAAVVDFVDWGLRWMIAVSACVSTDPVQKELAPGYLTMAVLTTVGCAFIHWTQFRNIRRAQLVVTQGYSDHWSVQRPINYKRLLDTEGLRTHDMSSDAIRDYRLVCDEEERRHWSALMESWQLLLLEIPWLGLALARINSLSSNCSDSGYSGYLNTTRAPSMGFLDATYLLNASLVFTGIGLGLKMLRVTALLDQVRRRNSSSNTMSTLIETVPADVQTSSSSSELKDTRAAVTEIVEESVEVFSGSKPHFVIAACTTAHNGSDVATTFAQQLPGAAVIGASSCWGVMSNGHFLGRTSGTTPQQHVMTAFSVCDPAGVYLVSDPLVPDDDSAAGLDKKVERAARELSARYCVISKGQDNFYEAQLRGADEAIVKVFRKLHKPGIVPLLVWLSCSGDIIDPVLAALRRVFGDEISVCGGSPADGSFQDNDFAFTAQGAKQGGAAHHSCAFALCWPSVELRGAFWSGYTPTARTGTVTAVADGGYTIHEIDGRPAAEVYNEWTCGAVDAARVDSSEENVLLLSVSTPQPIGVHLGFRNDEAYYQVLHPTRLLARTNSMATKCSVRPGTEVTLMHSSRRAIISRLSLLAKYLVDRNTAWAGVDHDVIGAIAVFCGGCMMYLGDDVRQVPARFDAAMGSNVPFSGMFAFGEQGEYPHGKSGHGNLMFSSVVFTDRSRVVRVLKLDSGEVFVEGEAGYLKLKKAHPALAKLDHHTRKKRMSFEPERMKILASQVALSIQQPAT